MKPRSFLKKSNFMVNFHTFSIAFCTLMFFVCNSLFLEKFTIWFKNRDSIDYLGLGAFFALAYAIFLIFFLLICHRKTTKIIAIILCIFSTIVAYFIKKYDVSVDRTMVMNALFTDKSEVHSLLSLQMIPYVIFLSLLPIIFITRLTIIFPKNYFIKSLKIILISLAIAVGFGYSQYNSIHRAVNLSRKKIVYIVMPTNYIRSSLSAFNHTFSKKFFSSTPRDIKVEGKVLKQEDLIVVLAIGETSRQKNFQLYGYDRQTNPILSKDKKLHVLNGKAKIGSTLYALPEILVKNDIPLTAITSKLGIDTSCYVNYSLYDNCAIPGEIKVSNCKRGKLCFDEDTIPYLQENLHQYKSGPRLVVLHLGGGSHGPSYHERYPIEFQIFTPICKDADVINKCSKEELYNTFDNTILYVDHVVGNIIKTLDKSKLNYVFIYLSDHGESLLEEGRIFHGMPPGIDLPPEQAQIPLIVKSSIPITIKKRPEYTQQEVFDTIIDLLNIDIKVADKTKSFISKNYSK
ncbi:MAG: phosphoethanolamine transferase [Alphaproteobacteria bacterium]|nr:phosphoethanolamine transferase [Alphaproteobacteria bacterium]